MDFQPDYRHFLDVMSNKRPARLPLYEHIISPTVMESILARSFADLYRGDRPDLAMVKAAQRIREMETLC